MGIGIVVLQILILRLWARKHPRGPLETLWRNLTWIGSAESATAQR